MTFKYNTKDFLVLVLALALPILAASLDLWSFLVDILVIVPFVWLGLRSSLARGITGVVIAALGVFLATGSAELAISKGLLVLGVSAVFTVGLAKGWRPGKILFWAAMPAVAYALFTLLQVAPGPILQRDPIGVIENSFTGNLGAFLDEYRQAGGLEMAKAQGLNEMQVKEAMEQGLKIIAKLFPAVLAVSGIFNVCLSFLLTKWVVRREIGPQASIGSFRNWSLPWYAVWGAILGIASYLAGDYWSVPGLTTAGINLGVIYFLICVVLGVSVTTWFFASPKVPLILKITFVFVTFFNFPVTSLFLAILGLFDMVMNFRKLPGTVDSGGKQ